MDNEYHPFGCINKYQIYEVLIKQLDNKSISKWVIVPKGVSPKYKHLFTKLSEALLEIKL